MATVTRFPSANAGYPSAGAALTNPDNAHADEGTPATGAPTKNGAKGQSYSGFDFDNNIPAGSTIDSVKIIYQRWYSVSSSIASARVTALIGGVAEEVHSNTAEPTTEGGTDNTITEDITADRTWTRDDLLDANFAAAFEFVRGNSNTAFTGNIDYIKVEVVYTVAYTIDAAQGAFSDTGQPLSFLFNRIFTAASATISNSGQAVGLLFGRLVSSGQGSFSASGQAADFETTANEEEETPNFRGKKDSALGNPTNRKTRFGYVIYKQ